MVIRFGATAGEHDFLRASADQSGDLFAGLLHRAASILAYSMNGRCIAEVDREIGEHRVEHFRIDGSGGIEVEVDAVHVDVFRIARETRRVDILPVAIKRGGCGELSEIEREGDSPSERPLVAGLLRFACERVTHCCTGITILCRLKASLDCG